MRINETVNLNITLKTKQIQRNNNENQELPLNSPSAQTEGVPFACLSFDRLSTSKSYSNLSNPPQFTTNLNVDFYWPQANEHWNWKLLFFKLCKDKFRCNKQIFSLFKSWILQIYFYIFFYWFSVFIKLVKMKWRQIWKLK